MLIRNTLTKLLPVSLLVVGLLFSAVVLIAPHAFADAKQEVCNAIDNGGCNNGAKSIGDTLSTVVDLLSAIGGVIAVIVIIIGGIKYVTSSGDSNAISSAKNTIIYAIVGIIIIVLAQVIVRFVLGKI